MKRFMYLTLTVVLGTMMASSGWAQEETATQTKEQVKTQAKVQQKTQTQTQNQIQNKVIHGPNFVDNNGDGFNDNAPDHDGDGIPNGQDPDYTGANKGKRQQQFVDTDGDGIADNVAAGKGLGKKANRKGGYGPGDGTGNQGVRPQNGTGYGPGAGTGNCDGTGPKGKANRGGKR